MTSPNSIATEPEVPEVNNPGPNNLDQSTSPAGPQDPQASLQFENAEGDAEEPSPDSEGSQGSHRSADSEQAGASPGQAGAVTMLPST